MKKFSFLPIKFLVGFSTTLIIVVCLFGCNNQKSPVSEIEALNKQNIGNSYDYVKSNLEIMGKGVAISMLSNQRFKSFLYSEIEKKFDGDYNVLVDKIDDNANLFGVNFRQNIQSVIRQKNARVSAEGILKAFADFNGMTYNPQIFIPFYEDLKKENKIGKNPPVFVVFDGDSKKVEVDGFVVNEDGKTFTQLPNKINESFAKKNEVWVFSLNERTGGCNKCTPTENTPRNGRVLSNPIGVAKIKKLNIKTHKENWLQGANDIYMKSGYTSETGLNFYGEAFLQPGVCMVSHNGNNTTCYIGDWPQNSLNILYDWTVPIWNIYYNEHFQNKAFGYGDQVNVIKMCFLIFEYDNIASENPHNYSVGNSNLTIWYRSSESAYLGVVLDSRDGPIIDKVDGYNGENGDIRVETRVE